LFNWLTFPELIQVKLGKTFRIAAESVFLAGTPDALPVTS